MNIAGLQKNSFIDYPGQIAAVVFTQGCNYDCFYCHNRILLGNDVVAIDENDVFDFLEKRKGMLDAVVITGGEPTLQKDLPEFIAKAKQMGYLVKLDTNGSSPDIVKELIGNKLIDYIAVDYKAPFDRYDEICGVSTDIGAVKRTFEIIKAGAIVYELRTTFVPQLSSNDIEKMLKDVSPVENYALQKFRMPDHYKEEDLFRLKKQPHAIEEFEEAKKRAQRYALKVTIR